MLFPIGDDNIRGGHRPLISYSFIVLNIVVFGYEYLLAQQGLLDDFILVYGSIPAEITRGEDLYTLITSMFLHGDWMHLLGNMLFLWIFADNIEAKIGSGRFLLFYLIGGLFAHAGHIFFYPDSFTPTVGASGAISAVMGAYLVMFPTSRVKLLFFITIIRVPAFVFLLFWIGQQIVLGRQSLGAMEATGVAWWAHIGGFVFGVIIGFFLRNRYLVEREEIRYRERDLL